VSIDIAGQRLQVWNVHPPAPRDDASRRILVEQLSELAEAAKTSDGPLVVAGDFNTTKWTPEFGRLSTSGLADAHQVTGRGLAATWPANGSLPPFLLLDHVLVSRELSVNSVMELPAGGSDHRPVIADLALNL
jgi:endonuclease/exonuclease/phosphatase (EEP) superfamily protein YafD